MRAVALAALTVVLVGCTASSTPVGSISSQAATQARTGPVISAPPVTPPSPPGDNEPAFACKDVTGGSAGSANVTAVRVGEQATFDRFVLQFDQVPLYTIKRQAKATFTQGASGQTLTLVGTAGVLITLHETTQGATYTGPNDLTQPQFSILKEAAVVQNFEGTVQWGIGLASPVCMRAFTLSDPARLVIDFSTSS